MDRRLFWLIAFTVFAAGLLGAIIGAAVMASTTDVKVRCTTTAELVETSRIETTVCEPG